jgi:SsrA-binding protein
MKNKDSENIIARNRKAYFSYQILEDIDVGIVLTGSEVKSLRANSCNITDSYADIRYTPKGSPELFLLNLDISTYKNAGARNHQPRRIRKLLIHKKEAKKLIGKLEQKGFTLVPLIIYFNHRGFVKVKLGLGKGKDNKDKRDTVKKREWNRQKSREMKGSKD